MFDPPLKAAGSILSSAAITAQKDTMVTWTSEVSTAGQRRLRAEQYVPRVTSQEEASMKTRAGTFILRHLARQ